MMERLALGVYSSLMQLLSPWVVRRLQRKARQEPGYMERLQERFGVYATEPSGGYVWIHAVSLGESRAAAVLIQRIRASYPLIRFLLTHGTATGMQEGMKSLQPGDVQVWQPWDTPKAVDRFLAHFKPRLGLLVETEIWPNLIHRARAHQIPMVLVNARMSTKTFTQSRRWSWLSRPALGSLDFALAQHEQDANLLRDLGCRVEQVVGNIKFDAQLNREHLQWGKRWKSLRKQPLVLLASSREGEESLFLDAIKALHANQPTHFAPILWGIVPRHPQRFEEVAALIAAQGFACIKRSSIEDLQAFSMPESGFEGQVQVFLGDSLGEMNFYYASANVALLGGSFLPFGGQNLIEAMACQCPILLGPHTFNFKEVAQQACASGAASEFGHLTDALSQALKLLIQPAELEVMSAKGESFIRTHQGATERTFKAIEGLLNTQGHSLLDQ